MLGTSCSTNGLSEWRTCAVQVLYWVNMASYRAIRPLCPAAAQARASSTGTDWSSKDREGKDCIFLLKSNDGIQGCIYFNISGAINATSITMTQSHSSSLTMSLSWFWLECSACRTLWDSRISCLRRCLPKATAPLVTIIISLPWFCSMATWCRCTEGGVNRGACVWGGLQPQPGCQPAL